MFNNSRKILINFTSRALYSKINSENIRVRFAPSPTGYLHLGGLRTALYNYLFARKHNGKFILRIEDTDQTRIVEGAAEQLYNDLVWSGIKIDEGPKLGGEFGPYVQSERVNVYREQINKLIDNGSAYHCFCGSRRLDLIRKEAVRARQIPKYDNRCRHLTKNEVQKKLSEGEAYCIRFKLLPGCETFHDLIYGDIAYDITLNEGDPVIMKSDGFPTYHFANVVDDHFMEISHVLRGVEWQISTTKHLLMYRAFGWKPPLYGHLPLLLNADGSKLSKRQGDIQISSYRDNGILPQALVNYITNSGGGFQKDLVKNVKPKCYSMNELTQQFNIENINVSSGKLMPERLLEFNRLEIQRQLEDADQEKLLIDEVRELVRQSFPDRTTGVLQLHEDHITKILRWSVNRINKLSDLVSRDLKFLWIIPKHNDNFQAEQIDVISKLPKAISTEAELTKERLDVMLRSFAEENNYGYSQLMKLLRTVLSGLKEGPSVGEMIEILGKENTLLRLQAFLERNNYSNK